MDTFLHNLKNEFKLTASERETLYNTYTENSLESFAKVFFSGN